MTMVGRPPEMRGSSGRPGRPNCVQRAVGSRAPAGSCRPASMNSRSALRAATTRDGVQVVPKHRLPVARIDGAVAGAARRQRNVRLIERVEVAEAVAAEHRHASATPGRSILPFGLVVVRGELLQRRVVVGVARARSCRAARPAPSARTRSSGSACRRDRPCRCAGRGRRPRRCPGAARGVAMLEIAGHLARLPLPFVVAEEERLVLDDRAAEHAAELVAGRAPACRWPA